MRRLTGLVMAGLCVCGSAAAQPGHLPLGASRELGTSGRDGGLGQPDFRTGAAAQAPSDAMLRNRLAAINRLRDAALEHGDAELIEHADRLERQARLQLQAGGSLAGDAPVRDAGYEYDPATAAGGITPASGHPIGGYGRDVSREAQNDSRDLGLPGSVNSRSSGREFGESRAPSTGFYSRRPAESGASATTGRQSEAWYDAQARGLRGRQEISADARLEGRSFGQQAAARARMNGGGLGADIPDDAHFDTPAFDRPVGADALGERTYGRQDVTGTARHGAARFESHSTSENPMENPFAPATFDAPAETATATAAAAEFDTRNYGARTADHAHRTEPVFDAGPFGDNEPRDREFGQPTTADSPLPGREFGQQPAFDAQDRGHAFGHQSEADAHLTSRRPGQQSSHDPTLYYGRDYGRATAAETRHGERGFGLNTAAQARSRTPGSTSPSGIDAFGATAGTSIAGALDTRTDSRRDGKQAQPRKPEETRPEARKKPRGLFSWFRGRK